MSATSGAMSLAIFILRVAVGGMLVAAGALKVGHAAELAASMAGFRLLPPDVIGPLALALPYFELLLGGYLLAGLFTRPAAVVAALQFLLYAAAIASAVVRHLPANCGCFGPSDAATADWPHVGFDLALAAAAAAIALWAPGALALDRRFRNA